MNTEYKSLRVEKNEDVVEVVLTGPGKGNAMGPDFWREMPELFAELDRDEQVRAVIVRGEGDNFSYGLDLSSMMESIGRHSGGSNLAFERTRLLDLIEETQRAFNNVASCRKPVIAAVSGWCVGGGLDLIAACDIRVCSAGARFSLREVKVAIIADLGSLQRLPHIIGEGHTRELAFTGKDIDAERARSIGLVSDVYETGEAALEAARRISREISDNPPLVVQGIKEVMNHRIERSTADGLRHVAVWNSAFLQSRDLSEAMAAFMERRPPRFEGR
ncbi:MAG TPA: crotonase/enoyl-CoA hydratase family protein [Blastocatellia bacterium]|jgi:enoyl-CoA hydratase|nr:crotonase/enoyl-CoA hydratase family protein [Blastocatellia bacterium]